MLAQPAEQLNTVLIDSIRVVFAPTIHQRHCSLLGGESYETPLLYGMLISANSSGLTGDYCRRLQLQVPDESRAGRGGDNEQTAPAQRNRHMTSSLTQVKEVAGKTTRDMRTSTVRARRVVCGMQRISFLPRKQCDQRKWKVTKIKDLQEYRRKCQVKRQNSLLLQYALTATGSGLPIALSVRHRKTACPSHSQPQRFVLRLPYAEAILNKKSH